MNHPHQELHNMLLAQDSLFELDRETRERIRGASILYILVTFNSGKWMEACVGGILAQEGFDQTLIVIDNGSQDDTLALLEAYRSRLKLVLVKNSSNAGYAKAVNAGLRHFLAHDFDFCFLLNADVGLRPHCVEELAAIAMENPRIGPLTPLHIALEGHHPEATFLWSLRLSKEFPRSSAPSGPFERFYTTPYITGAMMFFTRELIESVGLFDELFFFYAEDNDFCRRCVNIGRPPAVALRAQASHWHASNRVMDAFRRSNLRQGNYLMIMKHPGRPFMVNLAGVLVKYCLDLYHMLPSPSEFWAITRDLAACLGKMAAVVKAHRRDRRVTVAAVESDAR